MNNLLGEIPAWAKEDDSDDDDVEAQKEGDVEQGNTQQQQGKQYMEDFFREADSIKNDIDAITKASKDISKINEQSMRATTTAEEQKLSKKLKPLLEATNKRARRTKTLLKLLKEETDKLQAEGNVLNPSDIR
jgi:hypothetical protein